MRGAGSSDADPQHLGRVLVVEDERTIRLSIAGYLEDAGYTVDTLSPANLTAPPALDTLLAVPSI